MFKNLKRDENDKGRQICKRPGAVKLIGLWLVHVFARHAVKGRLMSCSTSGLGPGSC
jgi:hypothetical protein